jgi:hypothetical protein
MANGYASERSLIETDEGVRCNQIVRACDQITVDFAAGALSFRREFHSIAVLAGVPGAGGI